MSSRLLSAGQAEQDIELVYHLFEKYETAVRSNLIINLRLLLLTKFCFSTGLK
ncbi:MAG: hypothetical protein LBN93_07455 [Candidatus Symbiothrix sp.]|jgi:hypothetical protein|nr:hypothetical protein [Candidatus Symbiothrix sp.]